jgi:hypothetical protein
MLAASPTTFGQRPTHAITPTKVRFVPADRRLLAALLHRLPSAVLRQIRLLVRPETVLRRHRDLITACGAPS